MTNRIQKPAPQKTNNRSASLERIRSRSRVQANKNKSTFKSDVNKGNRPISGTAEQSEKKAEEGLKSAETWRSRPTFCEVWVTTSFTFEPIASSQFQARTLHPWPPSLRGTASVIKAYVESVVSIILRFVSEQGRKTGKRAVESFHVWTRGSYIRVFGFQNSILKGE